MPSYARNPEWTPDMVDRLRVLWPEGGSFAQLARELGVTRAAVSGKIQRLNLPPRPDRSRLARPAQRAEPIAASRATGRGRPAGLVRKPAGRAGEIAKAREESGIEVTPVKVIVDEGSVIPLTALTDHTCRWPIGDPRESGFGFCGAPPIDGKRYCQKHQDRAYKKVAGG
jgi:GcrA cell cycle regulator